MALTVPALQACFPLVATGVTVGVMAALDRRPVGVQTDDETIEWKASSRISDKFGKEAHVNVTSYNRKVLISGEVPNDESKARIGEIVRGTDGVQGIWNELVIGAASSLSGRSNDTYITSKVKARFVDQKDFHIQQVKVTTEAGTVYLMGLVSRREGDAATEIARTTNGVQKVVRVFEYISEDEAKRLDGAIKPAEPANP